MTTPSVAVMGAVYVDSVPKGARVHLDALLAALDDVLKVLLCYSNNFMAERLGDQLGGAPGLKRFLVTELGFTRGELRLVLGERPRRQPPHAAPDDEGLPRAARRAAREQAEGRGHPAGRGRRPGHAREALRRQPRRAAASSPRPARSRAPTAAPAPSSARCARANGDDAALRHLQPARQRRALPRRQDALVSELQLARGGPAPFTYAPQTTRHAPLRHGIPDGEELRGVRTRVELRRK